MLCMLWQAIGEIDAQLTIIADFDDQIKSLRIRYEITTKANKEVVYPSKEQFGIWLLHAWSTVSASNSEVK